MGSFYNTQVAPAYGQTVGAPSTTTSTGGMSMSNAAAGAGIATAIAGAYTSIVSGQIAKIQNDMQRQVTEFNARLAKTQAAMANAQLLDQYNNSTANMVTMMSAQGVDISGGSKANILRKQQEKLNFDLEYNKLSGEITQSQFRNEAAQYGVAGNMAKQAGVTQGLLQLASASQDFAKVK